MFTKKLPAKTAAVLAIGVWVSACATTIPESAPMALGRAVAPPQGYLTFCQRFPEECPALSAAASEVEGSAVAPGAPAQVALTLSVAAFASSPRFEPKTDDGDGLGPPRSEPQTAREPGSLIDAVDAPNSAAPLQPTDAEVQGDADEAPDAGGVSIAASAAVAVDGAGAGAASPALALDEAAWKTLNAVNREINRAIRYAPDAFGQGVIDRWSLPLSSAARFSVPAGDCEEYALEKRRALRAIGVPGEALSLALAMLPDRQWHAVLVVSTDKGDYVLDNRTGQIKPWTRVNYVWVSKESSSTDGVDAGWRAIARRTAAPRSPRRRGGDGVRSRRA